LGVLFYLCIDEGLVGTKMAQCLKQKSPAVSSEALQYVVPEAESNHRHEDFQAGIQ
jgi:hypothetical protein